MSMHPYDDRVAYYVIKICKRSNGSRKQLLEVLSRPMTSRASAEQWADFERTNHPNHNVVVVTSDFFLGD